MCVVQNLLTFREHAFVQVQFTISLAGQVQKYLKLISHFGDNLLRLFLERISFPFSEAISRRHWESPPFTQTAQRASFRLQQPEKPWLWKQRRRRDVCAVFSALCVCAEYVCVRCETADSAPGFFFLFFCCLLRLRWQSIYTSRNTVTSLSCSPSCCVSVLLLTSCSIMCKHILNAQVSWWKLGWQPGALLTSLILNQVYIQAPCCNKWFECTECHDEMVKTHVFEFSSTLRFTCKPCRKVFSRDFKLFSEQDKCCSYCQNKWILPGVTPELKLYQDAERIIELSLEDIIDQRKDFFVKLWQNNLIIFLVIRNKTATLL